VQIKKYLIWLSPSIWFGLTIFLTIQNGDSSGKLSLYLAEKICSTLNIQDIYTTEVILRDCAHFGIHFVLALLTMIATYYDNLDPFYDAIITLLLCIMIGITDELAQIVIPGRSFELVDILRNTVGILTGAVIFHLFYSVKCCSKAARH
jgi:VanZ family protein